MDLAMHRIQGLHETQTLLALTAPRSLVSEASHSNVYISL